MNTEKMYKETKLLLIISIILGVALLATGAVLSFIKLDFFINLKGFVGLSFLPFAMALISFIRLYTLKRKPEKMKEIITIENDERLVSIKNQVDAKSFRVLQAILFLTYMGYTLIIPADIFETVGWWIILGLLFVSFVLQAIFRVKAEKEE